MKRLPKTGMLQALSEDKNVSLNTEDLLEFERDFKRWHTHILLQKIKYFGLPEIGNNIGDSEPFVIIESLGIFNNLVNFSRRLNNELYKNTSKSYKVNPPKVSILYRGGSNLDIHVEDDEEIYHLSATFIKFNQEEPSNVGEILKFGINDK